jgi:hypothetical protein
MQAKNKLAAVFLFCGLAQAQEPQNLLKNREHPMPMLYNIAEETSALSHASRSESQVSAGAPQRVWLARYKAPANCSVRDIAIDVAEEVYVAGKTLAGYDYDFLTIKYNRFGSKKWESAYDGPGGGDEILNSDYPIKIIADYNNNIYVFGSAEDGHSYAYATLKYNASGYMLWARLYSGYIGGRPYFDHASDAVVDNMGNVYVTGVSGGPSGKEYATVKYDKTGALQWVQRHLAWTYRMFMALDPAGNVCVTGTNGLSKGKSIVTIKYNPAGEKQWAADYYGSLNEAQAIAIDAAGNVYVAGLNIAIKYSKAGAKQWVARFPAPNSDYTQIKMWVDGFENIYLTGMGINQAEYNIIKLNKAGVMQWIARYQNEKGGIAEVADMFVDNLGHVYVTGSSSNSATKPNWNYVTIKYNSAGERQWLLRYNGPQNGNDYARALAVDGSGNVYVTGESYNLGRYDIVTIKYAQNVSSASTSAVTDHDEKSEATTAAEINLPKEFYLMPAYPNPFNPSTTIRFGLPQASRVTLKVYNVLGKEVATLVDESKPAGEHAVPFAPKDLPSGIYFCVLHAGATRLVQRMIYAK